MGKWGYQTGMKGVLYSKNELGASASWSKNDFEKGKEKPADFCHGAGAKN